MLNGCSIFFTRPTTRHLSSKHSSITRPTHASFSTIFNSNTYNNPVSTHYTADKAYIRSNSYVSCLVMTTLEHVSVKHALDRLPSWIGDVDGNGNGVVVQTEAPDEGEVQEVSMGVAISTPDEEGDQVVNVAVEEELVSSRTKNENENEGGNGDDEEHEEEEGGRSGVGTSASVSGSGLEPRSGASRRSLRDASPPASVSHSRSGSPSPSASNSMSRSPSRSQSSMRGPLGMGESSVATSWSQADVEGLGRPSADGDSERRPSGEVHCRSSTDRLESREKVVRMRAPRYGTEPMSLPRLRASTDGKGGVGNVSKEEVLVTQEVDIGEEWHPLRYNGKERSGEDGEAEKEVEEDVALEGVHSGASSSNTNEKERSRTFGSAGRDTRQLHLEFKSPTPQPWDEVDPPTDNNGTYASDYYSTLNSKKFETLQRRYVYHWCFAPHCWIRYFYSRQRPLIPHSSYYFGPPPSDSAFGTPPVGQIGVHHPREIIRIERDYAGGELCQFCPVFPLELEGRVRGF